MAARRGLAGSVTDRLDPTPASVPTLAVHFMNTLIGPYDDSVTEDSRLSRVTVGERVRLVTGLGARQLALSYLRDEVEGVGGLVFDSTDWKYLKRRIP